MTKFPQQSSGAGFTLAELLIAIAILMLLLLVALINWKNQINKGFDARRKADISHIKRVFEEYYNDHGCYPPLTILGNCGGPQLQPYINEVPCDPQSKLPYKYVAVDDSNICRGYKLLTALDNPGDPDITSLGCNPTSGCGYGLGYNWGTTSGAPLPASGFDPTLTPTPTPPAEPGQYACTPNGICNSYGNPEAAGCPVTYAQSNCNNACGDPGNRCLQ